jgi:hypothetical protein
MTDQEQRLLAALAWMCEQYLGSGTSRSLDHMCMSAGEEAVAMLVEYGLVEETSIRGGKWTKAGEDLLSRSAECPSAHH